MGLVFLISILMVVAATTSLFTETPFKRVNILLVVVVVLGLTLYIYSWIRFLKKKDR